MLDTREKMRDYYRRFYDAATVTDVALTNWYVGEWFLFAEARWRLDLEGGGRVAMMTVEILPLGSDGKLVGRSGYGTSFE
ncbi:hypothetical protein GCM10009836_36750 [Pseudonocardia ailaonensis]|uniref:SnoaL-like domain-containing protein n=1 Tax=Pseudonocardia ailaonensis TaxID=367279 RepID=A0ABN2N592_9PSEU